MSEIITQTDEEAYADFAKRYGAARGDYQIARVLSGRLRELDKRTKAANKRADEAEANRIASIIAERDRCISILKSIEPMNPSEAHLIETIVRRMRGEG